MSEFSASAASRRLAALQGCRSLAATLLAVCIGSSASAQIFTDRTDATGLDFVHFNGMSGELFPPEVMGAGVALVDYDNDGDLDLYLVQGRMLGAGKTVADAHSPPGHPELSDRLYRNDLRRRADGTAELRFTDVTAVSGSLGKGYGMGVAAADYDGDGWVDLYVTNFGANEMLRNRGDGTFEEVGAKTGTADPAWSIPASFFDYDGDGWLDLYVGNYLEFTLANHRRCTSIRGREDYCQPTAYRPAQDRLFRNRGDGTFADITRQSGIGSVEGNSLGAVSGDFDGDGRLDLYVANDLMANHLWINRGHRLEERAMAAGCALNADGRAEASMGVDAADYDDDGDLDLFMTHLNQESNTLFVNDGQGLFRDQTARSGLGAPSWQSTGFGASWIDYDNDSLLDLLVVNGLVTFQSAPAQANGPYPLEQPNQLFRNHGDGRFEHVGEEAGSAFTAAHVSRGAAFGDIDNDGDVDVVVSNNSGPARLLLNDRGQARPWLGLRMVDEGGRRDLLGTRVTVLRSGQRALTRTVRTDGSYASARDPRLLFGLGDTTAVESVRARWPDGSVEQWRNPELRRYHTLRRGSGSPVPAESPNR